MIKNLCKQLKTTFIVFFFGLPLRLQWKFIVFVPKAKIVNLATVLHNVPLLDALPHTLNNGNAAQLCKFWPLFYCHFDSILLNFKHYSDFPPFLCFFVKNNQ